MFPSAVKLAGLLWEELGGGSSCASVDMVLSGSRIRDVSMQARLPKSMVSTAGAPMVLRGTFQRVPRSEEDRSCFTT